MPLCSTWGKKESLWGCSRLWGSWVGQERVSGGWLQVIVLAAAIGGWMEGRDGSVCEGGAGERRTDLSLWTAVLWLVPGAGWADGLLSTAMQLLVAGLCKGEVVDGDEGTALWCAVGDRERGRWRKLWPGVWPAEEVKMKANGDGKGDQVMGWTRSWLLLLGLSRYGWRLEGKRGAWAGKGSLWFSFGKGRRAAGWLERDSF